MEFKDSSRPFLGHINIPDKEVRGIYLTVHSTGERYLTCYGKPSETALWNHCLAKCEQLQEEFKFDAVEVLPLRRSFGYVVSNGPVEGSVKVQAGQTGSVYVHPRTDPDAFLAHDIYLQDWTSGTLQERIVAVTEAPERIAQLYEGRDIFPSICYVSPYTIYPVGIANAHGKEDPEKVDTKEDQMSLAPSEYYREDDLVYLCWAYYGDGSVQLHIGVNGVRNPNASKYGPFDMISIN